MNIFNKFGLAALLLILTGIAITVIIVVRAPEKNDGNEKQTIDRSIDTKTKRFWTIDNEPDKTIVGDGQRF